MTEILRTGTLMRTDSRGFLVNDGSVEKIQPGWREAVEEVKQTCLQNLGSDLHSIYLRGSLIHGLGREGISDIDLFVVLSEDLDRYDLTWIRNLRTKIVSRYPFVAGLDIAFVSLEKALDPRNFSRRFFLKQLSVCLYGEDIRPMIPPFRPDRRLALMRSSIGQEVAEVVAILPRLSPEKVRKRCSWIMKRILRTGLALVMEREGAYTRDLYLCYELFSKHCPEKEKEMRQALEWAINPISSAREIEPFLNDFGKWVADEFTKKYGTS